MIPWFVLPPTGSKENFFVHLSWSSNLLVHHGGLEALGLLDVDRLHVRVQLLLGVLLVVTLPRDAHPQTERHTLDTGFPDLLVQLGVETDVLGALQSVSQNQMKNDKDNNNKTTYHGVLSKGADFLDRTGSALLESNIVAL